MIVQAPSDWSRKSLNNFFKKAKYTKNADMPGGHEVWSNTKGDQVIVPALQGMKMRAQDLLRKTGVRPNARTYLDPSGWYVFDLGPKLGYAVLAPYQAGTLVTFPRGRSSKYPLMLARWRSLRTSPEIQRYKTRASATKAMQSFFKKPCKVGGMICPLNKPTPDCPVCPPRKK
jgi:hypothetical protein